MTDSAGQRIEREGNRVFRRMARYKWGIRDMELGWRPRRILTAVRPRVAFLATQNAFRAFNKQLAVAAVMGDVSLCRRSRVTRLRSRRSAVPRASALGNERLACSGTSERVSGCAHINISRPKHWEQDLGTRSCVTCTIVSDRRFRSVLSSTLVASAACLRSHESVTSYLSHPTSRGLGARMHSSSDRETALSCPKRSACRVSIDAEEERRSKYWAPIDQG